MMLKVDTIDVNYGRVKALKHVSLDGSQDELVRLLGANGAGKSTLLLTLSGIVRPTAGSVEFLGKRIDKTPAHEIACLGIAHVPEGRQLFPEMTVMENLDIGGRLLRDRAVRKQELDRVYGYFNVLADRSDQKASTLSGGEQQMLAIARGLMLKPKLLLLDEPSLGLAPLIVEHLAQIIAKLHREGLTILLVEQNARLALELADRGYVMENGSVAVKGAASDLLQSDLVKRAYLGL
jgi:branched-chain amino acid transport system ATP-binding protein